MGNHFCVDKRYLYTNVWLRFEIQYSGTVPEVNIIVVEWDDGIACRYNALYSTKTQWTQKWSHRSFDLITWFVIWVRMHYCTSRAFVTSSKLIVKLFPLNIFVPNVRWNSNNVIVSSAEKTNYSLLRLPAMRQQVKAKGSIAPISNNKPEKSAQYVAVGGVIAL